MRVARRLTGSVILVLVFLLGTALPAMACSISTPPDFTELIPNERIDSFPYEVVVGVYEFEFIARSPGLVVVGPRAVNTVTRYWGEPPNHLGPERTGSDLGVLGGTNCGEHVGNPGELGYWWVTDKTADQTGWNRSSLTVEGVTGSLSSDQEAILEERFGPAVDVAISFTDRTSGFIMAWQWQLLTLIIVLGAIGTLLLVRRRRKNRSDAASISEQ